ncbi:hypothetical protein chiPu_0025901 [Chiloscyllium punctatum]|uniref:VWFD domain-containing protein n=1 Tax=Chiloscyllium punctatum TaxID=137246 RepID=A0A401TGH8_CHIPU|nr:hypothetical protein [Chiloscyllium punctatum]
MGSVRVFRSGLAVALETDFGLFLTFDGDHYASISVPGSFLNNTCGLCGNFNNDPGDDMLLPGGVPWPSLVELGTAWQVEPAAWACHHGDCAPNCSRCQPHLESTFSSPRYCGVINQTDGPFRDCRSVLDPSSFLSSCVYDLCAQTDNFSSTVLCQAIQAYTLSCQAAGITIGRWRSRTFCGKIQESGAGELTVNYFFDLI